MATEVCIDRVFKIREEFLLIGVADVYTLLSYRALEIRDAIWGIIRIISKTLFMDDAMIRVRV